jgi:hypothetical protein
MRSTPLTSLAALLALASLSACNTCIPDPPARGSAAIVWAVSLLDRPATCADVGAAAARLELRNRSGGTITSSFPCSDGQGATSPLLAGVYDATLTLLAADGSEIAIRATQPQVMIVAGQVTRLVGVRFRASDHGKLVVSLVALSAFANCSAPAVGGAGLTGFAITLDHAADGCAPVTFTRARNGATLGTYTINCGSPVVTSCIEHDETLTVEGIASGPYAIGVEALRGPVRCWAGTDVLLVAAGTSTAKTVQLAPQLITGC